MPDFPALPTRLLFVCSQNRWRSLTAEELFAGHPTVQARSAGTEAGARVRVTAGHLGWAEVVVVMERRHAERLRAKFADALRGKPLLVLRIPDRYRHQDPALVALLRERLQAHFGPQIQTDATDETDATGADLAAEPPAVGPGAYPFHQLYPFESAV